MGRATYTQKILQASNGFLAASTELLLYWLFLTLKLTSAGRSSGGVMRAVQETNEMVDGLDKSSVKRSLYYLKEKGFIQSAVDKVYDVSLTQTGKEKLRQKFPTYFAKRSWDGKIYLVTYDIQEKRRQFRDLLREQLKRLGCARLQRSVWVSVYDPRAILREWADSHNFREQVVVSDVGRDGSIAGKSIPEIISALYDLNYVDSEYRQFIHKYENLDVSDLDITDQWQLNMDWATCVELDPQLPFSLLPSDFSGQEAYELYRKLSRASLEDLLRSVDNDGDDNETNIWQENYRRYLREKARSRHEVNPVLENRFTRTDFVREIEST